eukprot:Hpha_TRINITY_DN4228_c0_g1::TRINITY_DN4228_c0_g1_i1::g.186738::m.186738/K03320/amt, AMT, MEP; ammonium transporter, Amt family
MDDASPGEAPGGVGDLEVEMLQWITINEGVKAVWTLSALVMVIFMQTGFLFSEGGGSRTGTLQEVLLKNLTDGCLAAVSWFTTGYALAYGSGTFAGGSSFLLTNVGNDNMLHVAFTCAQMMVTCTVVSGSVAERVQRSSYFILVIITSAVVYPVVVHWLWSEGGWLLELGCLDYGGSLTIHLTGGSTAFVLAAMVGPRKLASGVDIFSREGLDQTQPSNRFHYAIGTFMLWVSWWGIGLGVANGRMNWDADTSTRAVLNITLAGSAATITGVLLARVSGRKHANLMWLCHTLLAGLVSVSAGCAYTKPHFAVLTGAFSVIVFRSAQRVRLFLRVDDVVDAWAAHGACGAWGAIAAGLFAERSHVPSYIPPAAYGVGGQVLVQLLAVVVVSTWCTAITAVLCLFFRAMPFIGLRVQESAELEGVDMVLHRGEAYDYQQQSPRLRGYVGRGRRRSLTWGGAMAVAGAVTPRSVERRCAEEEGNVEGWSAYRRAREAAARWLGWKRMASAGGCSVLIILSCVPFSHAEPQVLPPVPSIEDLHEVVTHVGQQLSVMWHVLCAAIIFLMQVGFSFSEVGSARATSVQSITFKNISDACVVSLSWWAMGYALLHGKGGWFSGAEDFFLSSHGEVLDGTQLGSFVLSMVQAMTAITIVSGAVAERLPLQSYIGFVVVLSSLVYPIGAHWIWAPEGWLRAKTWANGCVDIGGGVTVHLLGGTAAIVAAAMIGPRKLPNAVDVFSEEGRALVASHNKFSIAAGTLILWTGWFALNMAGGGSLTAGQAGVSTALGGASGAVTGAVISVCVKGYADLSGICNSLLAGLAAVSAGCAVMAPQYAVATGGVGAGVFFLASRLRQVLRIDDVVDAGAVHGAAGAWGALAVGLWADDTRLRLAGFNDSAHGLLLGGGAKQLAIQAVGVATVIAWAGGTTVALCLLLKRLPRLGLRVSEESELQGLDVAAFRGGAYDYLVSLEAAKFGDVASEVVAELVAFRLEPAESLVEKARSNGERWTPLLDAFEDLISNLRGYRPFLPDTCFPHESDSDQEQDAVHDSTPPTPPPLPTPQ